MGGLAPCTGTFPHLEIAIETCCKYLKESREVTCDTVSLTIQHQRSVLFGLAELSEVAREYGLEFGGC